MKLSRFIFLLSFVLCVCAIADAQPRFDGGYMYQPLRPSRMTKAGDGTYKILVIPAQYKDVSFFYKKDNFVKMLSAEGYSEFGAHGSAKEYLQDQVGANVDITVADIVTVKDNRAVYGKNNAKGNDSKAGTFIAEACLAADEQVDFSQFDSDGDGFVDNVFVFFAGEDEAQCRSEHPEYMWSHSYNLVNSDYGSALELDGVKVNNYACAAEIFRKYESVTSAEFDPKMAPIGTFCHEYLHNFGLVDLYDTDYEKSGGTSAGVWWTTSLMSSGNYNDYGNTPSNLNASDRMTLGVMTPQDLKPGDYEVYPLGDARAATYILTNPSDEAEFYLFEVRGRKGWDEYAGLGEGQTVGMLVYHIDKSANYTSDSEAYGKVTSADRWAKYNQVNANPKHQCVDLVEADGRTDINVTESSKKDINGVFFPCYGATSIGGDAKIKLKFWDETESQYALRNIRIEGDAVRFTCVNLFSPIPVDPTDPPKDEDMLYIIVLINPDQTLTLRASNSVDASVAWFYDDAPITTPSSFSPAADGTIRAEITWPDGSVDYLFKKHACNK